MKSHFTMMACAAMVTSIAVATEVPSQPISSTFESMVYDIDNDLTDPGDGETVDIAFEAFTVTLTPDNMMCDDAMWPTYPGSSGTPAGCGTVLFADGTTGLYTATDNSGGSAAGRNNLYIETEHGSSMRFKRGGTDCDASEYGYRTFKQEVRIFDSGLQAIGSGALCFDATLWDL